jgi:hypothetical protein
VEDVSTTGRNYAATAAANPRQVQTTCTKPRSWRTGARCSM